jgi:hypothetical protein
MAGYALHQGTVHRSGRNKKQVSGSASRREASEACYQVARMSLFIRIVTITPSFDQL